MNEEEVIEEIRNICESIPELDDNYSDKEAKRCDNALTEILHLIEDEID